MYPQLILPHSIVIYCIWFLNISHEFQGSSTGVGYNRFKYGVQEYTLSGNTAVNSRIAAETAEFSSFHTCAFLFRAQSTLYHS